jgi:iron complex outermembrane receptor protein
MQSMDTLFDFNTLYKEQTAALFGDATVPITDRFRVYGGVRVAIEKNDATQHIYGEIYPLGFPNRAQLTVPIGGCDALSGGTLPAAPIYNQTWHPVTPRAGLQFDFTDNIKGYVQWSKGFKDGGTAATACGNTFRPESLRAWEVGVKSTLFDNRLTVNLAAYRYNYNDMQIYQGVGSAATIVVNADSKVTGLDAEWQWRINDIFSADMAASILDDYFTKFASTDASDPLNQRHLPTVMVQGVAVPNLAGNTLPGVPNHTINTGLQAAFPLSGWGQGVMVRGEANFIGKADIQEWNRPETIQNAYTKINAILALRTNNGITIRAFGRNLTNKATTLHFLWNGAANVWSGQYAPPRTYGLEIMKDFGG